MPPPLIHDLCERYERNRDSYRSDSYNEAQARQEFINPLFKLLGWDMDNEQGYAEAYKDVVHEDAIRIGGAMKAPDYSFRIGGQRKFFLEAKKPRVSVVDQKDPAYQLRRYAWSAKLPLSILTNFSELAVYDCRYRPEVGEAAGKHRVEYFTYEKYAEKWEYLSSTFSRDAILKGSFDKYAQGMKGKRGTQEVDSEFLKEIELWRDLLAKNLKLRNKDLSIEDLNFSVGRIIDRIIFLRVCEDRGIEEYGQLEGLLKGAGVYDSLVKLFKRADERYNSGLFHFQKEKGRASHPDTLTPGLTVDDKILKEVLRTLYYPQSPYEFRVFPADILGQVYEQFLGKVIVNTGRSVEVEEKPEVRKAGGVYYTPTYIVDYIVKHTVGKLVEGKTPEEVSKLRVLDPACGSGSFLIGAYQYLLDWHLERYVEAAGVPPAPGKTDITKRRPTPPNPPAQRGGGQKIYETPAGWRLTLAERKRILLNNIYGVDIDGQAVEVTKLSLLLKVLEGSNAAEVQGELSLRHHALPDLGENIKCGNSLVGPDITAVVGLQTRNRGTKEPAVVGLQTRNSGKTSELTQEEIARINPFDWQAEFKDVFKQGGFDAVIGNPPYGYEIPDAQQRYFEKQYHFQDYQKDWYLLFLERYKLLLRPKAQLGVIVSNTWLQSITFSSIRSFLASQFKWRRVLLLPKKVFKATVDTHVLVFENALPDKGQLHVDRREGFENREFLMLSRELIPRDGSVINISSSDSEQRLFDRIITASARLDSLFDVFNGVKPFEVGKGTPPQTKEVAKNHVFVAEGKRPSKEWSPLLRGSLIHRYRTLWDNDYWIKYGPWLAAPRDPKIFEAPFKVLVRQTGDSLIATTSMAGYIARNNLHVILPGSDGPFLQYLLGLVNSQLLGFVYEIMNPEKGEALAEVKKQHVSQLPIRTINFKDKADKARHDKMVKLVERMLELNKKLPEVKTPNEREKMERQIAATDREIDLLVYELYGLTAEEIAVVEGRPHPPAPSP